MSVRRTARRIGRSARRIARSLRRASRRPSRRSARRSSRRSARRASRRSARRGSRRSARRSARRAARRANRTRRVSRSPDVHVRNPLMDLSSSAPSKSSKLEGLADEFMGKFGHLVGPQKSSGKKKSKKSKKSKTSRKSSYNDFVKKMTPVFRRQNPGEKQSNIMKLIGKEWKKQE